MAHLRPARPSIAFCLLGLAIGAHACTLDRSGAKTIATGGAGGVPATTSTGGGQACEKKQDCSDYGMPCVTVTCENQTCSSEQAAVGAPCMDQAGECNTQGECTLPEGTPCDDRDLPCDGVCVDGVCCNSACDGPCEECSIAGACEPIPPGAEDAEENCTCDGGQQCATGSVQWANFFGKAGDQEPHSLDVGTVGQIAVGGHFFDTIDFGGTEETATNNSDALAFELHSDGSPSWIVPIGGQNQEGVEAVAYDGNGNVYLCGTFVDEIGLGAPVPAVGKSDGFVVKLDATPAPQWSRTFGGSGDDGCHALTIAPNGNPVIGGAFENTANLGNYTLTATDKRDGFVAMLDASTGDPVATPALLHGDDFEIVEGLAFAQGALIVAGQFKKELWATTSTGTTTLSAGGGKISGFIAKHDEGTDWSWAVRIGDDNGDVYVEDVAAGNTPPLVVAGAYEGSVAFDGSTTESANAIDAFATAYDGSGNHLWYRLYEGGDDQELLAVDVDADGDVIAAGHAAGTITLGGEQPNGEDAMVVKIAGDGTPIWGRLLGGADNERATAVATGPGGVIAATGWFDGDTDIGGQIRTADGLDIWVTELDR